MHVSCRVMKFYPQYLNVTLSRWHRSLSNDELPEQDGGSPQNEGQDPRSGYHQPCHLSCPSRRIRQRLSHAEVAIKADYQQVHHGGI